ncbi:MAG: hypothetical protein ACOVOR_01345 [Rhabdochlamydiaceae bacterium]
MSSPISFNRPSSSFDLLSEIKADPLFDQINGLLPREMSQNPEILSLIERQLNSELILIPVAFRFPFNSNLILRTDYSILKKLAPQYYSMTCVCLISRFKIRDADSFNYFLIDKKESKNIDDEFYLGQAKKMESLPFFKGNEPRFLAHGMGLWQNKRFSYKGSFINGLYDGKGLLEIFCFWCYKGEFKKGKREGKGVFKCVSADTGHYVTCFRGLWVNDNPWDGFFYNGKNIGGKISKGKVVYFKCLYPDKDESILIQQEKKNSGYFPLPGCVLETD